jgi:hypothetical protein
MGISGSGKGRSSKSPSDHQNAEGFEEGFHDIGFSI